MVQALFLGKRSIDVRHVASVHFNWIFLFKCGLNHSVFQVNMYFVRVSVSPILASLERRPAALNIHVMVTTSIGMLTVERSYALS